MNHNFAHHKVRNKLVLNLRELASIALGVLFLSASFAIILALAVVLAPK